MRVFKYLQILHPAHTAGVEIVKSTKQPDNQLVADDYKIITNIILKALLDDSYSTCRRKYSIDELRV